jgi:hypothetical protein
VDLFIREFFCFQDEALCQTLNDICDYRACQAYHH